MLELIKEITGRFLVFLGALGAIMTVLIFLFFEVSRILAILLGCGIIVLCGLAILDCEFEIKIGDDEEGE